MTDFILLGSYISGNYKVVYNLFSEDKIRCGYNKVEEFGDQDKNVLCYWFTSFEVEKDPIRLVEYDSSRYRKYNSFDTINIDRLSEIPDYDGYMGVPANFVFYYDRRQFQILGGCDKECICYCPPPADEIECLKKKDGNWRTQLPYFFDGEKLDILYHRIFIRKR